MDWLKGSGGRGCGLGEGKWRERRWIGLGGEWSRSHGEGVTAPLVQDDNWLAHARRPTTLLMT